MTERKLCSNCGYQKSVGVSIACQRCFNKSLWKPRSKTMTKEELVKEADKYADDYATPDLDCSFRVYMFEASKEGYLAGAEPREKRIAELEAQIEKMKCCANCKHSRTEYEHCRTDKHEKWEIKEK